jgi:1-deoxy-D-xylulose-5-phosphate reductoisomerase
MSEKKGIAILGSTGSIGTQALEVIESYPELFDLRVITAHSNAELLIEQAKKFMPQCVVIGDESKYAMVEEALYEDDILVYVGEESLKEVVTFNQVDMVLTALVGYAGLQPTLAAIQAGKDVALANKETLVVAGELVTKEAKKYGVNLLPVIRNIRPFFNV